MSAARSQKPEGMMQVPSARGQHLQFCLCAVVSVHTGITHHKTILIAIRTAFLPNKGENSLLVHKPSLLIKYSAFYFAESATKMKSLVRFVLLGVTIMVCSNAFLLKPSSDFDDKCAYDPYPPSTPEEMDRRQRITDLFYQGWSPTDGFKTPKDQIDALDSLMESEETGHLPSTYGEITDLGARQLFDYLGLHVDPRSSKYLLTNENIDYIFVDLGCGSGKLLVQSYVELPNVNRIIGIELANARYRAAIDAWDKVKTEASQIRHQAGNAKTADMEIYEGDLYKLDISSATHIYVASLCFTNDMMRRLAKKMIEEGGQLRCIATLKQFPAEFEKNLGGTPSKKFVEMSWSDASIYLYSVKNNEC